jgi:chorismate mutase / prephenate dehydratase
MTANTKPIVAPNSGANLDPTVATPSPELQALRQKIDATDAALLLLLNQRASLALEVGHLKAQTNAPILRPEREAQVIAQAVANNKGPLSEFAVTGLWREIISVCRSLELRLKVAFLGPTGTFTEQALFSHFGLQVDGLACLSIDEVFRSVQAGAANFGVVPVENSTEGAVNRTLDLFLQSTLQICAEVSLPIRHHLLASVPFSDLKSYQSVKAHPQALAQCHRWLSENAPHLERIAVSSNAEGARIASVEVGTLAIAGEQAMQTYGLHAMASNIQDDPLNRTRFAIIGNHHCEPSGNDQTSVIVSVPDKAGAVHSLIEPLARHGVSMKRFESRPARQSGWEYNFYIDLMGHRNDANVKLALKEIEGQAKFYKVVGSYPRAK